MIKRLQFRGISRSPSDRMTEDGGCAESVNVVIEGDECCPVPVPEDMTAKLGLPVGESGWQAFYIHKTKAYQNVLVTKGNSIGWFPDGRTFKEIFSLGENESVFQTTSLGNTIVIVTGSGMYYLLFRQGEYGYLGNGVPFPAITFYEGSMSSAGQGVLGVRSDLFTINVSDHTRYPAIPGGNDRFLAENRNTISMAVSAFSGGLISEKDKSSILQMVKDTMSSIASGHGSKCWNPFFVVYGIAMNDGSELYSIPVLIHPDNQLEITCFLNVHVGIKNGFGTNSVDMAKYYYSGETYPQYSINVTTSTGWDLYASMSESDYRQLSEWKDIVTAVNVYVSKEIDFMSLYDRMELTPDSGLSMELNTPRHGEVELGEANGLRIRMKSDMDKTREALLEASLFYLAKTFVFRDKDSISDDEDVKNLVGGCRIDYPSIVETTPSISDKYKSMNSQSALIPSALMVFNSRLLLGGVQERMSAGPVMLNAVQRDSSEPLVRYEYAFEVTDDTGSSRVVYARDGIGETVFSNRPAGMGNSEGIYMKSYGFLICPYTRCTKVYIRARRYRKSSGSWIQDGKARAGMFDMSEHPKLSCSYLYESMYTSMWDLLPEDTGKIVFPDETPVSPMMNKIYQSSVNQPFTFPVEGRHTVSSGDILGMATATKALSTGQFGLFPVYVFTTDGIWVLGTAADGTFSSILPMSREVCSSGLSISPIDQAVVFSTERGAMLLEGSSVAELSPYMNGRHYSIEDGISSALEGSAWEGLIPVLEDDAPFMNFIGNARACYDYRGHRLIFWNADENWQYVYKFDTSTWHKLRVSIPEGGDVMITGILNSYPECYVSAETAGKSCVLNLSVPLAAGESQNMLKSIVVSRPFDLDEPDVYKVIRQIRLRGNFGKGKAQYILLASDDGISFRVVRSLHAGSAKLYRIAVLMDFSPSDRFSWVDVDFDTRYTGKLR